MSCYSPTPARREHDLDGDNEFARYLTSFLVYNDDRFITGEDFCIDHVSLETLIKEFMEILP